MAVVDLLSAIIGAVVGGLVVVGVLEIMGRARPDRASHTKATTAWRLSELGRPLIMARDVSDVDVPAGARIVASGFVDPVVFEACEVRQVPDVRMEGALDAAGGRAMLFLAGVRRDAVALVTSDPELVSRVASEARSLWETADPYVERLRIGDLSGRTGVRVETTGTVQDVLPHGASYLLRLADGGDIIGVVVAKDPAALRGQEILVRGRLEKDRSGFPAIHADDVRRLQ